MELLGETFDLVGKVMIAYTAIRVHTRFRKEHRVDDRVFTEMKKEQVVGIVGIVFIVFGYVIKVFYLF